MDDEEKEQHKQSHDKDRFHDIFPFFDIFVFTGGGHHQISCIDQGEYECTTDDIGDELTCLDDEIYRIIGEITTKRNIIDIVYDFYKNKR